MKLLSVLVISALAFAQSASAQQVKIFISSSGSDAQDCASVSTACRTINGAMAKVSDGGTITCVDVAYYGSAPTANVISKTVTIDCRASGGASDIDSLVINASGKNVRIRNMTINPSFVSGTGLDIQNAAIVELENVVISNAAPNNSALSDRRSTSGNKLSISNSAIVTSNRVGILIAPTGGGSITAVLDNVRSQDHTYGIAVGSGGRVLIKNSIFSGNATAGIEADGGAQVEVINTVVLNNNIGVQAFGTMRFRETDFKFNSTAIQGQVSSFGSNRFSANGTIGSAPAMISQAPADLFN